MIQGKNENVLLGKNPSLFYFSHFNTGPERERLVFQNVK